MRVDFSKNHIGYDAFGNRSRKTEYQTAGELVTTYRYNTKNQLMQENDAGGTKDYAYDHRGNLLSVTSGEGVLRAYGFDAANQMSSSMGMTDGTIQKAVYQYNGLGHRMGQNIATGDAAPAQTIRYTLDMTRQYHNLLQKTTDRRTDGNLLHSSQTYFWDGNVAGMEEEGRDHFYFQDDLGSPMRLADEAGRSEEAHGFDEFGNDIRTAKDIFQDSLQSFGFTGYQMDSAGGLYFAQARRYDAGAGRFVSEDFLKGHIAVPYTMNHYSYCWNRPMDLVDLNGMWPSLKDIGKGIKNAASSAANGVKKVPWKQVAIIGGSVLAVAAVTVATGGMGTVAAAAIVGGTVGASASLTSRAVTDIVTGTDSSWQNYVGDGVGGTVAGIYTAITHDASSMVAGVISGSVSAGVTDVLNNLTEEDDKSGLNIIGDMLLNGVVEGVLGKVGDKIKINKITKGRGNYAAVFKGGLTRFVNKTAKHMSAKVAMKGFASNLVSGIPSSTKSMTDNIKEKLQKDDTEKE